MEIPVQKGAAMSKKVTSFVERLEARTLRSGNHASVFVASQVSTTGAISVDASDLRAYIENNEGDYYFPYLDGAGNLTIGIGSNIDPKTVQSKGS